MRQLHIDIETFCGLNLSEVGVYRYASDPSFKIILFAYAFDDEDPVVLDLYENKELPQELKKSLTDGSVLKIAHNANFETVCIQAYFNMILDIQQWRCTQVGAAYLGLPLGLDKIAKVLNLTEQKDAKGKSLITYFSQPCKPTKKNKGRTVNMPRHDPEKWQLFKEYNAQDVRTEREIGRYLARFEPLPLYELLYWKQDQQINARGVLVDLEFIEEAIKANTEFLERVHAEIKTLTGVDNPNSLTQLKKWLEEELDSPVESLSKESLQELIAYGYLSLKAEKVLKLRQLGSKTSVSKYKAMQDYACADGRIRGLVQFYGANRTGRFAGRGVQVQNLKRTPEKGAETMREAVRKGLVDLLYDDVPEVVSCLVRTAIIASEGRSLVVSDFSAIEARVLAWLAGEEWVLEVFRTHGKLYEATASKMFGVALEQITKGSELRQKGKVAALALGYQGASGALLTMGDLKQGLTEEELPGIVRSWRRANPAIVKFWRECESAAKHVVERKNSHVLRKPYTSLEFRYDRGYLFITLPSGRRLSYYGAQVTGGKLSYWGVDQTRKTWVKIDTYGGSLVENITQAVARDCLVNAMYAMRKYDVIMHVHDEVVLEVNDNKAEKTLNDINHIMSSSPEWAKDLPLSGEGYISKYYKK